LVYWEYSDLAIIIGAFRRKALVSQFLNPQEENVETEDKEEINTHKNLCYVQ
jgi:hypothetical protein